jgi:hypothetical protein
MTDSVCACVKAGENVEPFAEKRELAKINARRDVILEDKI